MNKVILMGRLTRDPEVKYTNGAEPMAIARYCGKDVITIINNLAATLVMWWCNRQLVDMRRKGEGCEKITIFEIRGTGKEAPKYLMFTDTARVKKAMSKI